MNTYTESCYFCNGNEITPDDIMNMIEPLLHGGDNDLPIEYMKQNKIGGRDPERSWWKINSDYENPLTDEIYAGAYKMFYKLLKPVAELVCENHHKYIFNQYPNGFSDIMIHNLPAEHERFNYTRLLVCPICLGSNKVDWISYITKLEPDRLRDHEKLMKN